jgi:hypothetical protein
MEVEEEAYYEYPKPLTPKLKITNTKPKSFKCDNNMHKFISFNLGHSKMKLGNRNLLASTSIIEY